MFKRYFLLAIALISGVFMASYAYAEEAADKTAPKLAYFTLEPDITTNFFTKGDQLGYIQVHIDIMVADSKDVSVVEKNQPLIRDAIIELLGKQTEDKIKSLAGREDIRKTLVKQINDLLLAETGRTIVADLLFTKYMYQ
jgi:flagellar FliL protein